MARRFRPGFRVGRRGSLAGLVVALLVALVAAISQGVFSNKGSSTGSGTPSASTPVSLTEGQPYSVIEFFDGDTLVVNDDKGVREKVRLGNINTPERGQPGYGQASEALRELVGDAPVTFSLGSPDGQARDKYGRIMAYIFNAQRKNVNVEIVRLGWSKFVTRFGEGPFAQEFHKAEAQARRGKKGIWALE